MASYGRLVDESHIAVVVDQTGYVRGFATSQAEVDELVADTCYLGYAPIVFWRRDVGRVVSTVKGDVAGNVVQVGQINGPLVFP